MGLIHVNTPTLTVSSSGTNAYVGNSKTPFITVANASTGVAQIFSGGSGVTISGDNFTAVLPGTKETFSIQPTDTHIAVTCTGAIYIQRGTGE